MSPVRSTWVPPQSSNISSCDTMGATAQFHGVCVRAHAQDSDGIAILFTEQRHGTFGLGLFHIGDFGLNRGVTQYLLINLTLDFPQLFRCYRLKVGEVEPQFVRIHQ